jgi:predicted nuclease of restriction endonuclease-like (RecB) superfamily
MSELKTKKALYDRVVPIIEGAKNRVLKAINQEIVQTYWQIGKEIVEEEQDGKDRAEYGKALIETLSQQLTEQYGKGYTKRNLRAMRQFYRSYVNWHAVRAELTWTHYRLLIAIEEAEKRSFYELECINSQWSTRELDRQINSLLFERLTLSKEKSEVLEIAKEGQVIAEPKDLVKDPYVLEFLGLPQSSKLYEKDLESGLIEHLQQFLLELGKGFSFVARQQRIQMDDENYYVDLVFFNYHIKCFVLIDLKIGKLTHQDLGQMQMYVNYYTREKMEEGDNKPIGIVLCADKSEAVVKYTLSEENKQIFASRYKLYLPSEEELKAELLREREIIEREMD